MAPPQSSTTTSASSTTTTASIIDLDTSHVMQKYTGEARIQRLLCAASWILHQKPHDEDDRIATASSSSPTSNGSTTRKLQAYWLGAIQTAQEQRNVLRYKEIYRIYHEYHHQYELAQQQQQQHSSEPLSPPSPVAVQFPPYDSAWVADAESQNRVERENLLGRLHTAQARLHKESIRTAYTLLSYYYIRIGDIHEGFGAAVRAKDYCTSRSQTTTNSLLITMCAIYLRQFITVADFIPRLEHTMGILNTTAATSGNATTNTTASSGTNANTSSMSSTTSTSETTSTTAALGIRKKIGTASGLERLANGDYRTAALKFRTVVLQHQQQQASSSSTTTTTSSEYPSDGSITQRDVGVDDWDRTMLSPDDAVLYAVVLTLATETHRSAEVMSLISNLQHPDTMALGGVPILLDVLTSFYQRAAYQHSWDILETHIWPRLQYDLYFGSIVPSTTHNNIAPNCRTHLSAIQDAIRYKAMGLYWQAYHNCPVSTMAAALGPGIAGSAETLRSTLLDLLSLRFRHRQSSRSGSSRGTTTTNITNTEMYLFPMDTRLDMITNTLVRSMPNDAEQDQDVVAATQRQFHDTSTRVLNDTYSMIIRLACIEHKRIITSDSSSRHNNNNSHNDLRPPQQQQNRPSRQQQNRSAEAGGRHNNNNSLRDPSAPVPGHAAESGEAAAQQPPAGNDVAYNDNDDLEFDDIDNGSIEDDDENIENQYLPEEDMHMVEDEGTNEMNPEDLY